MPIIAVMPVLRLVPVLPVAWHGNDATKNGQSRRTGRSDLNAARGNSLPFTWRGLQRLMP